MYSWLLSLSLTAFAQAPKAPSDFTFKVVSGEASEWVHLNQRAGRRAIPVEGALSVDASLFSSSWLDFGHNYFAGDHRVTEAIANFIRDGAHPAGLPGYRLKPDGKIWQLQKK